MAIRFQTLVFTEQEFGHVVDLLRDKQQTGTLSYWVNIEPDVEEGEVHTGSLFWKMFSSRGPMVPKFTWVPSSIKKQQQVQAQIGITHPVGASAIKRLRDFQIEIPSKWHVQQDHPKRGIVISLPDGYEEEEVVLLAIRALRALSPFDFSKEYRASIPLYKNA
jgi:hypothetical protein